MRAGVRQPPLVPNNNNHNSSSKLNVRQLNQPGPSKKNESTRSIIKKSTPRLSKNFVNKSCLTSANATASSNDHVNTVSASPAHLPLSDRSSSSTKKRGSGKKEDDASKSDGYSSDEYHPSEEGAVGGRNTIIPESIQKALLLSAPLENSISSPRIHQYLKLEQELEKLKQKEKEFRRNQGKQFLQESQQQIKASKLNPTFSSTGTTTASVRSGSSPSKIRQKEKYLEKKESIKQWEKRLRERNWRRLPPVSLPRTGFPDHAASASLTGTSALSDLERSSHPPPYIPVLPMTEEREDSIERLPFEETKSSFFRKIFDGVQDSDEGLQDLNQDRMPYNLKVTSEDEYSQSGSMINITTQRRSSIGGTSAVANIQKEGRYIGNINEDYDDTGVLQWSSSHLWPTRNQYNEEDAENKNQHSEHSLIRAVAIQSMQSVEQGKQTEEIQFVDQEYERDLDTNYEEDEEYYSRRDHHSDDDLIEIPMIRLSLSERLAPLLLSATSSKDFTALISDGPRNPSQPAIRTEASKANIRPDQGIKSQQIREDLEDSKRLKTFPPSDPERSPKSMVYQQTAQNGGPFYPAEEKLLFDRVGSNASGLHQYRSYFPVESSRYSGVYSSIEEDDSSASERSDGGIPEFSALNAVYKSMRYKKEQQNKAREKSLILQQRKKKEEEAKLDGPRSPRGNPANAVTPSLPLYDAVETKDLSKAKDKDSSELQSSPISLSPVNKDLRIVSNPDQNHLNPFNIDSTTFRPTPTYEANHLSSSDRTRHSSTSSAALKLKLEMMKELSKQDQIFQYAMELQEIERPNIDVPLLLAAKQQQQVSQQRATQFIRTPDGVSTLGKGRAIGTPLENESNDLLRSAESTMKQSERLLQLYIQLQKERAKNQADQKYEEVKSLAATLENVRFINHLEHQMQETSGRVSQAVVFPTNLSSPPADSSVGGMNRKAAVRGSAESSKTSPTIILTPYPVNREIEKKTSETQTVELDIQPLLTKASTTQTSSSPSPDMTTQIKEKEERKTLSRTVAPAFIDQPLNEEEQQYKRKVFLINQKHKERMLWLDQLIAVELSSNEEADFERRKFESIYQMELQSLQREKYVAASGTSTISVKQKEERVDGDAKDHRQVQQISKEFHENIWKNTQLPESVVMKGEAEEDGKSIGDAESLKTPSIVERFDSDGVRLASESDDADGHEEVKKNSSESSKDDDANVNAYDGTLFSERKISEDFDAEDYKLRLDDSSSQSEVVLEEEEEEDASLPQLRPFDESQSRNYHDDQFEVVGSTGSGADVAQSEEEYSGFPEQSYDEEQSKESKEFITKSTDEVSRSVQVGERRYSEEDFEEIEEEGDRYPFTQSQSHIDVEATMESTVKGIALSGSRYAEEDFEIVDEVEEEEIPEVEEDVEKQDLYDEEEDHFNQHSFSYQHPEEITDSVIYQEDFETSVKPAVKVIHEKSSDSLYLQDDFEEEIPEVVDEVEESEVSATDELKTNAEDYGGFVQARDGSSLEYSHDMAAITAASTTILTDPINHEEQKSFEEEFEVEESEEEAFLPRKSEKIIYDDESENNSEASAYQSSRFEQYEPSAQHLSQNEEEDAKITEETDRYEDDFLNESTAQIINGAVETKISNDSEQEEEVIEEELQQEEEEPVEEATTNYDNESFQFSETFAMQQRDEERKGEESEFNGFESMEKPIAAVEETQPSVTSEEEEEYSEFPLSPAANIHSVALSTVVASTMQTDFEDDFEHQSVVSRDLSKATDPLMVGINVRKEENEEEDDDVIEEIPEIEEGEGEEEDEQHEEYNSFVEVPPLASPQRKPPPIFTDESESFDHSTANALEASINQLIVSASQYANDSFEITTTAIPGIQKKQSEVEDETAAHETDDEESETYEEEDFEEMEEEEAERENAQNIKDEISSNSFAQTTVVIPSQSIPTTPPPVKSPPPQQQFEDSIEDEIEEALSDNAEADKHEQSRTNEGSDNVEVKESEKKAEVEASVLRALDQPDAANTVDETGDEFENEAEEETEGFALTAETKKSSIESQTELFPNSEEIDESLDKLSDAEGSLASFPNAAVSTSAPQPTSPLTSQQDDELKELADLNPNLSFQTLQSRKTLGMMLAVQDTSSASGNLNESSSGGANPAVPIQPLQTSSMYFDYDQQKWLGNEEVSLGGFESSLEGEIEGEEDMIDAVVHELDLLMLDEKENTRSNNVEFSDMLSIEYSTETVSDILDSAADGGSIEYFEMPPASLVLPKAESDDEEEARLVAQREKAADEITEQLLQRLLTDSFQAIIAANEEESNEDVVLGKPQIETLFNEEKLPEKEKESTPTRVESTAIAPSLEDAMFDAIDGWNVADATQRLQQSTINVLKDPKTVSPINKDKGIKDMTSVYRDRMDELYSEFSQSRNLHQPQSKESLLFGHLFPMDDHSIKQYLVNKLFAQKGTVIRNTDRDRPSSELAIIGGEGEDPTALFTMRSKTEWDILDHSIGNIVELKITSDLQEHCHQIADTIFLRSLIEAIDSVHASLLET